MKKGIQFFVVICLSLITSDIFGQGCSQCKMLSKQGSELTEASFGTNINWGILYLMIIPYIMLLFLFRKKIVSLYRILVKKR